MRQVSDGWRPSIYPQTLRETRFLFHRRIDSFRKIFEAFAEISGKNEGFTEMALCMAQLQVQLHFPAPRR